MRRMVWLLVSALCGPAWAGDVTVEHAWVRATPPHQDVSAAYLTVTSAAGDRLVGVSSPDAAQAEVHTTTMTGGVMHMDAVPDGLLLPPGKAVTLKPGGTHIMVMGLTHPLKRGESLRLDLAFEKAGHVVIAVPVTGVGGPAMPAMPGMTP